MMTVVTLSLLLAATPSDDHIVAEFVAFVEAEGLGAVVTPACWSDQEHVVCYGLVGGGDLLFGIGFTATIQPDGSIPFETLFMAPLPDTEVDSTPQGSAPPEPADLRAAVELEVAAKLANVPGINGISVIDCRLPNPSPDPGVEFTCYFSDLDEFPMSIEIALDVNSVPVLGDTITMSVIPPPETSS